MVYYKQEGGKKPQGYVALDGAMVTDATDPGDGKRFLSIVVSAEHDQDQKERSYRLRPEGDDGDGQLDDWLASLAELAMAAAPFQVRKS
jgi:hypothetical protein